jgi:hypothetical protein
MSPWVLVLAIGAASGFDHFIHEGRVTGSGGAEPMCADCHTVRESGAIQGVPGHAQCFGACHGKAPREPRRRKPYAIAGGQRALCTNCHSPDEITRLERAEPVVMAAAYPPYAIDPDYALNLSHAKHANTKCTACHDVPGAKPRKQRPHDRCAGCHAGPEPTAAPAMTACATCHRSAFGPAVGPTMERGAFPVVGAFDHVDHAKRLPTDQRDQCLPCHDAVTKRADVVIPAPTMSECATCHEGQIAFATTAARCRTCHQRAGTARPRHRERQPFSHAKHSERGMQHGCDACHRLTSDGSPQPPGTDHQPCAESDCHASEFKSAAPAICGTCHVGSEPWRPLRSFPLPRNQTEFGATFSHAGHKDSGRDCEFCHAGTGQRRDVAGGHAACSGKGCHDADAAEPPLRECERCHDGGLRADRERAAIESPWSVRAQFRHDRHESPCTDCHVDIDDSTALADIGPPGKQRCASCHDGRAAFKMTGHRCSQCHAKSAT